VQKTETATFLSTSSFFLIFPLGTGRRIADTANHATNTSQMSVFFMIIGSLTIGLGFDGQQCWGNVRCS
jgi:hypothetical protein